MERNSLMRRLLLAALIPALIAGCDQQSVSFGSSANAAPQPQAAQTAQRGLPDFTALVEREGPAVVAVATTQKLPVAAELPFGIDEDDPLFEFFRRFQIPRGTPAQGLGSGFIISSDGFVLTNAHVVANASEVNVKLTDKREFKAKVIGSDRKTDIALLKIAATGLPAVRIGDAARVKVGEWVAAMGSPFGFENTVTAGIVSAKSRSLPDESYVPFLQTDVAINPGNSGGPLFNMAGEVIGINSQIYSRTGGYMGLSFAIPIDVAMKVKDQLQKHGKVSRGRMGVVIQELSRELAESFGLKKPAGALVNSVEKGGPADRAGVKPGDVILAYNGTPVERSSDLPRLVGDTKPGQSAKLRIWRAGAEREVSLTVDEMPAEKVAQAPAGGSGKDAPRLGVAVRSLTPEEKKQLGEETGVVVEQATGAAARAGIQPGDVILAFNNQKVGSPEELRRLLGKSPKQVALLVQRGDTKLFVPIRLG